MDRPRSSAVLRLPRARRVGPGARLFTYRGFEAASARATPGWAASDPSTSRPGYETQLSELMVFAVFRGQTRAVLARSRGGPAPEPARRLSLLAPRPAAATAALPAALHRRLHCSLRLWSVAADGRQPLCGWRTSTAATIGGRQLQLHVHAVQRARRRLLKVALRSCDALPRRTAGTAKRHELVGCSGPNAVAAKPYQMRQRRRRGR